MSHLIKIYTVWKFSYFRNEREENKHFFYYFFYLFGRNKTVITMKTNTILTQQKQMLA